MAGLKKRPARAKPELRKSIGKSALFLLCINSILGTGIFFLPSVGAFYAGSASLFSWLIMSVVAVIMSLYFAELVSLFPTAGGIYDFVKHAFGQLWGFVFGWLSWVIANITIAMLIIGSLLYILPAASVVEHLALAVVFIVFFNFIAYRGIEASKVMIIAFGLMTLGTLLFLIVPGLFRLEPANFAFPSFSLPIVLLATYFISETFFGWETSTYISEEVKDARHVMPKMLVISTLIIALISMLLIIVSIGASDIAEFASQKVPLSYLAQNFFGSGIAAVFSVVVFIPLIGTAASWIVASPRLLYAMSRDRVLVPRFSRLHAKYRTPANAIVFQSVVTALVVFIGFGSYFVLLSLLIPLVIISYSAVMLSVVKLRFSYPRERPFSAPFARVGPLVVVAFNAFLLAMWIATGGMVHLLVLGILLVLLGFPMYVVVSLQYNPKFTEKFFDRFSGVFERILPYWYSREVAKSVVSHLSLTSRSSVLDFGSGSGFTAKELSKKARLVVAVDMSEKQLSRAKRRVSGNIIFFKHRGLKPFEPASFDAVTAVGVLEHLPRPLEGMDSALRLLKPGGSFSFLSFGRSFGIPAPAFLDERLLRQFFRSRGVAVSILVRKNRFTEYWHIWGKK